MSSRKISLFYAVLIAIASMAVTVVITSKMDLTPSSSAQTVSVHPPTVPRWAAPSMRRRSATSPSRWLPPS